MSVLNIIDKDCVFHYQVKKESELLQELVELAGNEQSAVYAMFTDEIVIGTYEEGELRIGRTRPFRVEVLGAVDQLRELRIFNKDQEIKVVRFNEVFKIRVLKDGLTRCEFEQNSESRSLGCLEETQKIWGNSRKDSTLKEKGWTPLISDRGTHLYFPQELKSGAAKGVVVRNYIEFEENYEAVQASEWKPRSGYRFVDERMVEFRDWKPEGGEKDGE